MSSIDRIVEAARQIALEVNPSDEFVALNRKRLKEALDAYDNEKKAASDFYVNWRGCRCHCDEQNMGTCCYP